MRIQTAGALYGSMLCLWCANANADRLRLGIALLSVQPEFRLIIPIESREFEKKSFQMKLREIVPECYNNLDDDKDGWVDFVDLGCLFFNDNSEFHIPSGNSECDDGLDNDQNGWKDGFDLGCQSPFNARENLKLCASCGKNENSAMSVVSSFLSNRMHPFVSMSKLGFADQIQLPYIAGGDFGFIFDINKNWEIFLEVSLASARDATGTRSAQIRTGLKWFFLDYLGLTGEFGLWHTGIFGRKTGEAGGNHLIFEQGHVGIEGRFVNGQLRPYVEYTNGVAMPADAPSHGIQGGIRLRW